MTILPLLEAQEMSQVIRREKATSILSRSWRTVLTIYFVFFLQEVLKKVRSILNKLTPQKFQTLMQQILELEINTEERLTGTIDLIFEKVSRNGSDG